MAFINRLLTFDPLCTPWSRKGEAIAVIIWFLTWLTIPVSIYITVDVLFYSEYWHVGVAYLIWIYFDREIPRRGGRRWSCRWRLPFPKLFAKYFPLTLVKTAELDPTRNYLLACHPHGLIVLGITGNLATDGNNAHLVFPGMKTNFLTFDLLFFIPIFREVLLAMGGCSVNAESITTLLQRGGGGNLVLILPGGSKEALYAHPGSNTIYLKKRKGFIKVAIQNGAPVVPVYSFGETDTFSQLSNPEGSWRRALQDNCLRWFGVPFPLWYGRGLFQDAFGFLPRRHPITTVVGAPIEVIQTGNPTTEYIDKVHAQYIDQLRNLYYKYRQKYGNLNSELEIE